jgi:hypothetical protein
MIGKAKTDDEAEKNDDALTIVNEERQMDGSLFSIGEGVVHVHMANRRTSETGCGSIGDRLWNRFFGNVCNIATKISRTEDVVLSSPTRDKSVGIGIDWCRRNNEMEAFNSAVQVLLRSKRTPSELRRDDQYSSIPHCEQLERWDCGE